MTTEDFITTRRAALLVGLLASFLWGCDGRQAGGLLDRLGAVPQTVPEPAAPPVAGDATSAAGSAKSAAARHGEKTPASPPGGVASASGRNSALLVPGTGRFVGRTSRRDATAPDSRASEVRMNFQNADMRDVITTVLGELGRNVVIDPRLQGTISLRATEALSEEDALSVLDTVLRMNGAAMILGDELIQVVPAALATRAGAPIGALAGDRPIPAGFAVRVVPLRYVAPGHMRELLAPFLPPDAVIRTDEHRNLLLLAGNGRELETVLDTVALFDVDWLAGMSVALFPLEHAEAGAVAAELALIFGDADGGPTAGLVRVMPIERLNGLLVVTPQPDYLAKAQSWIRRLDRGDAQGRNLYVYNLEHGKAGELAARLTAVFSDPAGSPDRRRTGSDGVAPGRSVRVLERPADGIARNTAQVVAGGTRGRASEQRGSAPGTRSSVPDGAVTALASATNIRIIADEANNALMVLATAEDYAMVEKAIRKLDAVPMQVLVEATIAEVTLNDELRYGVQWFFKTRGVNGGDGRVTLGNAAAGQIADVGAGFSYILSDAVGATRFALEALEGVTQVQIISSPHLLIQDNQSAELQVGDEVPVVTQQQQAVSGDANLVNTVQFRETGVILRVTPRVNSGGSIAMEIEQEVSQVQQGADASLTPTISQRRVKSAVVVQSGETMILGGLIQSNDREGSTGFPVLGQLPVVGPLFASKQRTQARTELIVLIAPRIVRNEADARRVTEEMRQKLENLKRLPGFSKH